MSHDHDHRSGTGDSAGQHGGGRAPGKRALTDRMVRRAQRVNPRQVQRHGVRADQLSHAPAESAEFAHDVAAKQQLAGLQVDGIVGPSTARAVAGDPFDFLGGGGGGGGGKAAPTLYGSITHYEDLDGPRGGERTRVVVGIGTSHGVTSDTVFTLCDAGRKPIPGGDLRFVSATGVVSVVHSRYGAGHISTDMKVRAMTPAATTPELHGDGSIGDDGHDRLEI